MAAELIAVTERVHLARTALVNWTLVAGDDGVLLIDAGFPGDRADVLASLRQLGFGPADVRAILLTHAHVDHLGSAIWFAAEHGTPVYCHAAEVGHARRDYLQQAAPAALLVHAWRPRWLRWSVAVAARGGLVRAGIPSVAALTDEVAAGLPGRPRAVPAPGHTDGHCCYLVDGVAVTGDALVTGHPLLPARGPQLLPAVFNHDPEGCRRSLDVLGGLGAEVLIPGHGGVWRGPIAEAARQAAGWNPSGVCP